MFGQCLLHRCLVIASLIANKPVLNKGYMINTSSHCGSGFAFGSPYVGQKVVFPGIWVPEGHWQVLHFLTFIFLLPIHN